MTFLTIGIMSLANISEASPVLKCDYKMLDLEKDFNPEPDGTAGGRNQYIVSVMFIVKCVHKDGTVVPATIKFSGEKIPAASREEAKKLVRSEAGNRAFKELKEQCKLKKCDGEEKPKK